MVLQAQFVVIDALIGVFEAGIREMLVTIADVVLPVLADPHTRSDMIAELEAAAKLALIVERSRGQEMHADPHDADARKSELTGCTFSPLAEKFPPMNSRWKLSPVVWISLALALITVALYWTVERTFFWSRISSWRRSPPAIRF